MHARTTCVLLLIVALAAAASVDAAAAKKNGGGKGKEVVKGKEKFSGDKNDPVIGIDLGTTYSCVAVFKEGEIEIVANDLGERTTPSWVAFTDTERLIGQAAKNQVHKNPKNTLYDVKRLIGRGFDDAEVQKDIKAFPFSVIDRNGKPYLSVKSQGKTQNMSPEEVSAMVLTRMKDIAEEYVGKAIKRAVITVPAYFTEAQRLATKNAGRIAGLDVMRIINEPTAAALAYGLDKGGKMQNVLVFDLGGGTFDVSLLTLNNGVFEVLATNGDTRLGGEDFDRRLVAHFAKQFEKKTGVSIKGDLQAIEKLRRASEDVKRQLSSQVEATVEIADFKGGKDFNEKLTRAKFEELCLDLFKKTLLPVDKVLQDAGLSKRQVDEIVLVGGSTRIPKVRALLKDFFNGKEPNQQAGLLAGSSYEIAAAGGSNIVLLDVTPLSMGIETTGGIMTNVVERNTVIPTRKSKVFTTEVDNQGSVNIQVFQGERQFTRDNTRLGGFTLAPIPPAPRGVPQIEVTFNIDANGLLTVTAVDLATKKSQSVTITNSKGRLTDAEIERMINDAAKFKKADQQAKKRLDEIQGIERQISDIRSSLDGALGKSIDDDSKAEAKKVLKAVSSWMRVKSEKATLDEIKVQKRTLNEMWDPIVKQAYASGGGGDGGGGGGSDDEPRGGGGGGGSGEHDEM